MTEQDMPNTKPSKPQLVSQGLAFFLAIFAVSTLIWWPVTRLASGVGLLMGALFILVSAAVLGLSFKTDATGSWPQIDNRKAGWFWFVSAFRQPETWMLLLIGWIVCISAFKFSDFTARDLPIYIVFVMIFFAMKKFDIRKHGKGLSAFLLLVIIGTLIGGVLRNFDWSALFIEDGRAFSINTLLLIAFLPVLRVPKWVAMVLGFALWSIPFYTTSRWAVLVGAFALILCSLYIPGRTKVWFISTTLIVLSLLIFWTSMPSLIQKNAEAGSVMSVSSAPFLGELAANDETAPFLGELAANDETAPLRICSAAAAEVRSKPMCLPFSIPIWFPEVRINTSGRTSFWFVVFESLSSNLIVGGGAGSSSVAVQEKVPQMEHPHSEPLRVLHDFGIVGFLLSVGLLVSLLATLISSGSHADPALNRWRISAILSILVFLLLGTLENFLVFPWIICPIAAMLGIGIFSTRVREEIFSTGCDNEEL